MNSLESELPKRVCLYTQKENDEVNEPEVKFWSITVITAASFLTFVKRLHYCSISQSLVLELNCLRKNNLHFICQCLRDKEVKGLVKTHPGRLCCFWKLNPEIPILRVVISASDWTLFFQSLPYKTKKKIQSENIKMLLVLFLVQPSLDIKTRLEMLVLGKVPML